MFPFAVKATFFDKDEQKTIYLLLYGKDIVDIAQRVKQYCDPEIIEINLVGDEAQLFEVSEDAYYTAILGNGDLIEGAKILKDTQEDNQ